MNEFWHDIGACEAYWKDAGIGRMNGGCRWRYKLNTQASHRDYTGDMPHDKIVSGYNFEVETICTPDTLNEMMVLMPGTELSDESASQRLTLTSPIGISFRAEAGELILKPVIDGEVTTDETQWVRVPLTYPEPDIEVVRDNKAEKQFKVLWVGLDNQETGVIAQFGKGTST